MASVQDLGWLDCILAPSRLTLFFMLFDFRYAPGEWHRTIECDDWADAREIATSVATARHAEWVEVHSFNGATETWRCLDGKWQKVNT